jgi:hypothetical protein
MLFFAFYLDIDLDFNVPIATVVDFEQGKASISSTLNLLTFLLLDSKHGIFDLLPVLATSFRPLICVLFWLFLSFLFN